ncbi:MAG TPA: ATP-binding protein [Gaiellaceae bacterium]|nr:ATP-binding protein [Gaiellaceae bacterium]
MSAGRLRRSFGAKLLAAQLLVVVAGGATLLAIALSLGPILFHRHIRDTLGVVPPDVARHLDIAYNQATFVALATAIAAAAVAALAVSWFVSRRVTGPIGTLVSASAAVARGGLDTRVPVTGEDELAALARSFNEMAARLEQTEQRRRELFSDVAHELRTPLATIDGYAQAVGDGVLQADERIWGAIRAEVARLTRLADDLQKVSRAEERQLDLHLVPTAPQAIVEAALVAASPAFEQKGVELAAELDADLPPVQVDRDRLAEVLANLLENALRHTPATGRVTVSAHAADHSLELAVADSGEGIPPEHLPRLFERFYRVDRARDRARGGAGIGLAIAKAITEAHGGRIAADSAGPGAGSTFRVTLPARQ